MAEGFQLNVPQSAPQSLPSEITPKRKKVPLKPGHSLADWVRLGKENPGIARVNRPDGKSINLEELCQHNTKDDCW